MVAKKIAILSPVLPPYHGGMGKAALAEAEALSRHFDVTIFTPKYSYINSSDEQRGSVKIKYIKPIFAFGNAAILSGLKKELQNFDIVYLHYPFFGTAELFNFRFQISDFRFIIRYHMDIIGRSWIKPLFWLHTKLLMPKILSRADKIIVSAIDYARNSNIKKLFARYPEKFIEIPFGVDLEEFKSGEKDPKLLAKYNLGISDKIILFVGSLDRAHYFKGLSTLLRAISNLKSQILNLRLIIVGDGELGRVYKNLARELGIGGIVKFVGGVSNESLPQYYNLANVFVFPSIDRSEAFGLALLEAIACGKAVVASNLPGVRTLVFDSQNGFLVKPGNTQDLAKKIKMALENEQVLGKKSRALAEEKYAKELIASKFLDFFNKI